VPPIVTRVSLTPGTVRSLLAIDSVKASLASSEEPLGSSIFTENMLRSSVAMNSFGNTKTSMMLAAEDQDCGENGQPTMVEGPASTLR